VGKAVYLEMLPAAMGQSVTVIASIRALAKITTKENVTLTFGSLPHRNIVAIILILRRTSTFSIKEVMTVG
jgi:hypothetical protein